MSYEYIFLVPPSPLLRSTTKKSYSRCGPQKKRWLQLPVDVCIIWLFVQVLYCYYTTQYYCCTTVVVADNRRHLVVFFTPLSSMGIGASHHQTKLDREFGGIGDGDGEQRFFGLENFGNTCYCNSVLQARRARCVRRSFFAQRETEEYCTHQ